MWCLETIKQINQAQATGLNAYEAYEAVGIRTLGNTAKAQMPVKSDDELLAEYAEIMNKNDGPESAAAQKFVLDNKENKELLELAKTSSSVWRMFNG